MDLHEVRKQLWVKEKTPILVKEVILPNNCTGWLVIDSLAFGSATGGVRLGKDVNLAEVKQLADEMTLKYTFYNLRVGGAKAGINCPTPLTITERRDVFSSFGRSLTSLLRNHIYYPGTDLGTNQKDIDELLQAAEVTDKANKTSKDSSYYTAVSVFAALKGIASYSGNKLAGHRIAIQGLGKVGINLLRFVYAHGLTLVAVSTQSGAIYSPNGLDIQQIFNLAETFHDEFVNHYQGAKKIGLEALFEKDMDILSPCAGIYPIHLANVKKIRAKIIVPGCNVAADQETEALLYRKGIIYLPGFVCNAGGVLGYRLKWYGIEEKEVSQFLSQGVRTRVIDIMTQAKGQRPLGDVARSIARKNQDCFRLESKAKMNGNMRLSMALLKSHGVPGVLRIIILNLARRKLIAPYHLRKALTRRALFPYLFGSFQSGNE